MQNRNMFFVCLNSVKQTEKDVDLIVSLCHNYHASEERLKEMMDKSHKAIEDVSA
jgi:retinoblastoma-like protein 1